MTPTRIAATFPGKFGDLLWALPTVRAISEHFDQPVNLILSDYLAPIVDLLNQQPYIQQAVSYPVWQVEMTAPLTPRVPPTEFNFDRIFHLGLDGWPLANLPKCIEAILHQQWKDADGPAPTIDFRPWITAPRLPPVLDAHAKFAVGFTDEWFELKFGIHELLILCGNRVVLCAEGSRWQREAGWEPSTWIEAAQTIHNARAFLGCCSALHVLSVAIGKPTVVMEPNVHRHHPIFWPEQVKDRVHQVLGGDGEWTFDARHVRETIEKFL